MRVVDIWPQQFGKRLSRLQLPEADFVIIFGSNGTGKSTYADLLIALLLERYDTALMSRHGTPGTQVRGEINLTEGDESVRIEFDADARVPDRSSRTKRQTSNPKSNLWTAIEKQVESEIIRNIYRVDSIEIVASLQNELKEEGIAALKKRFRNYASGDKRGVNYTAIIDSYRQLARSLVEADSQTRRGRDATKAEYDKIVEERAQTETSQAEVERYESVAARLSEQIAELGGIAENLRRQLQALDLTEPLQDADTKGKEAQAEVDRLEAAGLLLSERFSLIASSLEEETARLKALAESDESEKVSSLRQSLAERVASIQSQVTQLGIQGDETALFSRILANADRDGTFARLNTAIEQRSAQQREIDRINIVEAREKLAIQIADVNGLEDRWSRLRVQDSASNPIDPAELWKSEAISANISRQSSASSFEQAALIVAAGAAVALGITSDTVLARIGGFVVALILGGLTAKRLLRKADKSEVGSTADGGTLGAARALADELLQARRTRDDLIKDLAGREVRIIEANTRHDQATAEIKQILSSWGLRENPELTSVEAVAYQTALNRLASDLSDKSSLEGRLVAAEAKTTKEAEDYSRISAQVRKALMTASLDIDLAAEGSPQAAVGRLESLDRDFKMQEGLRQEIRNREKMIDRVPLDLKELVGQYLAMSESERSNQKLTIEDQQSKIDSEIDDRKRKLTDADLSRKLLLQSARLPQLNEQISSLKVELESLERSAALKQLQATLLEQLATARQEDSTPELERRVAQIALTGAPEWKVVRRADDETFWVTKDGGEVRDSELSSGELSVLFLAIRIAMIQQEDQKENALRLPLICDDPLLHLDKARLASTFTMMVQELKGRQTLFFTCKPEIRELANSLSVPVIDLDERSR